jgi:hypothetical protein
LLRQTLTEAVVLLDAKGPDAALRHLRQGRTGAENRCKAQPERRANVRRRWDLAIEGINVLVGRSNGDDDGGG